MSIPRVHLVRAKICRFSHVPTASCCSRRTRAPSIEYVQRAVGYSLTAMTEEQCLFFLYGTGKNGKSLFAETLRGVLGDYWMKAPASMLMVKRSDRIPNDVARLPGARMVVSSETTAGRRMDEALVKDLTGDDSVAARFLN